MIQARSIIFFLTGNFCFFLTGTVCAQKKKSEHGFPKEACGVYLWPGWQPVKMNRETVPLAKGAAIICPWKSLEPEEGVFRFEKQIGDKLRAAVKNDYYVSLALWTSPNKITPEWLYRAGVPGALFEGRVTPFKEKKKDRFPYYFSEIYRKYFYRLLERTGGYLQTLPEELRERISFVEVCEGATGDPAPYYGEKTAEFWPVPLNEKFRISRAEWSSYRIKVWGKYHEVFQGRSFYLPLLVKSADIHENEFAWCRKNLPSIGSKQALFCEYYQHSGSRSRLAMLERQRKEILDSGGSYFTRGEYDAQWKIFGWSQRNPEQALYWTAICAANAGLDVWQVHYEALQLDKAEKAVRFFNRYAGKHDPQSASAAFCALRRGLDASDINAFPEAAFGKARRSNRDRYGRIAAAFRKQGAYQGDPGKAIGGVMLNRRSEDYNDVGWDILQGNYGRFLKQIDPERTSIGWWHKGPEKSIYGRFARGFDVASGKDAMFFRLEDGFIRGGKTRPVLLRVIYLDEGTDTWSLSYHSEQGMKRAWSISNTNSGRWREKMITVSDAAMNHGGPRGADLVLESQSGDAVFHLLEVEKISR